MEVMKNRTFDEERALYGSRNIYVKDCAFDGPADGESAFKEASDIQVENVFFNLRYPFWHDERVKIDGVTMTELCRAAIWYTNDIEIRNSKLHGIKALRECSNVKMDGCDIISPEFGWSTKGIDMRNTSAEGEYFMMRSSCLHFDNVSLKGKYSFQYNEDCVFENCNFDTKDALWHAKNVVVRNSVVKGEYLAWYCENVTFDHCKIIGTQPLCYCKNLKLIDCEMVDTDLSFEKSEVEATVTAPILSIKNPLSGRICVPEVGEVIMDDEHAKGEVMIGGLKEVKVACTIPSEKTT